MTAAAVALLAALAAAPPLACPPGTELRGAAPPEGYEVWCEGKDDAGRPRREGPSRTYYDDGSTWIETAWRAGEMHGPFVERHRGGAKAREGAFANGKKSGRWITSWASGRVEEDCEWKDGVPHGRFASFWANGAPRSEGRYCGGAQCGRWRSWDVEGRELGTVDYGEQTLSP